MNGIYGVFSLLDIRVVRIAASYNAWRWVLFGLLFEVDVRSLVAFHVVPFPMILCLRETIVSSPTDNVMTTRGTVCNLEWFSGWRSGRGRCYDADCVTSMIRSIAHSLAIAGLHCIPVSPWCASE